MTHRKSLRQTLTAFLAVMLLGVVVFAAKEPQQTKRVIDPSVYRAVQYAFPYPDEHMAVQPGVDRLEPEPQQLGAVSSSTSPGVQVGVTWQDMQQIGSMGRMNETSVGTNTLAHFSWVYYFRNEMFYRRAAAYCCYNITN